MCAWCLFTRGLTAAFGSVSYTHLDVYKRQLISILTRSLLTSTMHPFLGRSLLLFPYNFPFQTLLSFLASSIISTCPSQLILCTLMSFTISFPLISAFNTSFFLIHQVSPSSIAPHILLKLFLLNLLNWFSLLSEKIQVLQPKVKAGRTMLIIMASALFIIIIMTSFLQYHFTV